MEGTDATPEEVAEFREIFNLVDLDGGGSIDLDELRELMDLLGMNASKDEMEAMVNEIDSEGTGEISFHDFVKVMSKKVTPDYTPDQVVSAFKKFANKKTPNGYITKEDLIHVLSSYEGKMPEEDARELVEKIDCDPKTGLINYVEYVNMMMADAKTGIKK
jgi:calmodulin